MYQLESAFTIIFRKRELLNILVFDRRLRHRELRNKGNLNREFDTGDIVVVRKHAKSSIKYGVATKRV